MLSEEQVQERNAYLMNTVPGTRIILHPTVETPVIWSGFNTLLGYDGYSSMYGYFEFKDLKSKGLVMSEDSPHWDFETHGE